MKLKLFSKLTIVFAIAVACFSGCRNSQEPQLAERKTERIQPVAPKQNPIRESEEPERVESKKKRETVGSHGNNSEATEPEKTKSKVPIEWTNSVGMKFRLIPAGKFKMGSPVQEYGSQLRELLHEVEITKPFYIGIHEVTQRQWRDVMKTRPWKHALMWKIKEAERLPATYIDWEDADAFCKALSRKENKSYRLPTEAEWEYACRAGAQTAYCFGDDRKRLAEYGWVNTKNRHTSNDDEDDDILDVVFPVGQLKPNAFGLYDMHGNVFEWCSDFYDLTYYSRSPRKDPQGPLEGDIRVQRGGDTFYGDVHSRSAFRHSSAENVGAMRDGFRVVLTLGAK